MLPITKRSRNHLSPLMALALVAIAAAVPVQADDPAQAAEPTQTAHSSPTPAPADAGAQPTPASRKAPDATPAAAPDGVKRIMYVPEIVKAQLREEIKKEVLAEMKQENGAASDPVPSWLKRFKLNGEFRGRFERDMFGRGNANGGEFPDFNTINTGNPFDVNFIDYPNERYLNVDQDRTRPRLRARVGTDGDLGKGFTVGLRLGSGDGSSSPVSSQTLGGSGGYFSKYQFWLDRAFLKYAPLDDETRVLGVQVGRFQNPFFSTELLWSDDIVNFDGVAVQGKAAVASLTPFFTAGAFPIYTTGFAFPAERPDKFASFDKSLFAVQLGTGWKATERFSITLGAAFYYFNNIEGRISSPCDTDLKSVTCNTDDSRPSFAQKGNTYMALRTPSAAALQAESTSAAPRYEYFGLASRFRELAATGRLDFKISPPLKLGLSGEWVRNVGFSARQIAPVALNNKDRCDASGNCDRYVGGNSGYLARLTFASPTQDQRWDWNVGLSYRYLESDAVVDAFTDPDFGLGGTNLKGFVFGAALAVADNVWTGVRWLSADAIVGPTYRADVLQVDVSARF